MNITAMGVTQYTLVKLVISALTSDIKILSFSIRKTFWLNNTQNIRADMGINFPNSLECIGQKIFLILLLNGFSSDILQRNLMDKKKTKKPFSVIGLQKRIQHFYYQ